VKPAQLCQTDGCDDPKATGSPWCADCGRYYARATTERRSQLRAAKRARGECLACSAPAEAGRSLCPSHAARNRAAYHARKEKQCQS
jgi:hypothetical protein